MSRTATIGWQPFADKHKQYIKAGLNARMCCAEGAIRSGKTIDNCILAAAYLDETDDIFHLATGATIGNAKLNIGVCNGFGLENLFRGRCHWGKYRDNEALYLQTKKGQRVVIFAGGGKADSYKRILGNSYGLWIATEINEHYDSDDSRISFLKVANGRQIAAKRPYTLWDLNPCNPRHPIYEDYIDAYKQAMPGYVYEHFTIADNLSVTPERLAEIQAQYVPGSVWYRRDILGERCVAEGLVYQVFADRPQDYIIDSPPPLMFAEIGVDFGGGTSGHAFVCVGYTPRYKEKAILEEYYCKEALNPQKLEGAFIDFVRHCQSLYLVTNAYCDSAEQTLINGLRQASSEAGLRINIGNALKKPINDRIRCDCRLMAGGRFKVLRHCTHTIDAFSSAVWDDKKVNEDARLDNGTSNIDVLDAQEYATERHIGELLNYRGVDDGSTLTISPIGGIR